MICSCDLKPHQTGVYPHPLGAGSARPNPKKGTPDTENPSCIGFTVLRGGLRPWSGKGPDHLVEVDPSLRKALDTAIWEEIPAVSRDLQLQFEALVTAI